MVSRNMWCWDAVFKVAMHCNALHIESEYHRYVFPKLCCLVDIGKTNTDFEIINRPNVRRSRIFFVTLEGKYGYYEYTELYEMFLSYRFTQKDGNWIQDILQIKNFRDHRKILLKQKTSMKDLKKIKIDNFCSIFGQDHLSQCHSKFESTVSFRV